MNTQQLRDLAANATRIEGDDLRWIHGGRESVTQYEDALIEIAPQLASLAADMADALEAIYETDPHDETWHIWELLERFEQLAPPGPFGLIPTEDRA